MTEAVRKLFDRKGKVVRDMEAITAPLKSGGKLTDEQRTSLNNFKTELRDLDLQIEDQETLTEMEVRREMKGAVRITDDGPRDPDDIAEERANPNFDFTIKKKAEIKHGPIAEWYLRNFDVKEKIQRANVYNVMKALHPHSQKVTNAATIAALDECRSASGTALITEFLSAQLIDGGLSKSRLAQAGMQVQVMEEPTKRFAKVTAYPTFTWEAENATTTDKTVTFSSVDLESKTLRGFVTVSGELAQDGHNLDSALRAVFNKSIGNSVDTAGLYGAGTATEPEGIKYYTNVNTLNHNDSIENYDMFIKAAKLILDDNGELPTHSIMNPSAWMHFNLLKEATTNAPLALPAALRNHTFLETSKLPENEGTPANRQTIFMGGFRSLNLGVRLQTQVMISPVVADKFQFQYFVAFRGDLKPYREEDFAIITNVSAPDVIT
jgi:HK97 family phage major capsid protein